MFDASPSGQPINHLNQDFLDSEIKRWWSFAKKQGVPFQFGEFGVHKSTLNAEKGGLTWVQDMLSLLTVKDTALESRTSVDLYLALQLAE